MDVKIEPRKKSDRGGYLMMPLLKNVPIAPRASWKLVRCPVCGAKCWDRPYPEGWEEPEKMCTMCALKKGLC